VPSEIVSGIVNSAHLPLPSRTPAGYLLLTLFLLFYLYLLFRFWDDFARLSRRRWLGLTSLAVLAFLLGGAGLPWPFALLNPEQNALFFPFVFAPIFLAGAVLGSGPALLVGLLGGLSHAVWHSHNLNDLFFYAFVGALYGFFLAQQLPDRAYQWLRNPFVAGIFSAMLCSVLLIPAAYAYMPAEITALAALDLVLSGFATALAFLVIEAAIGGLVVLIVLIGVPQWRAANRPKQASASARTISGRLMTNFTLLSISIGLLVIAVILSMAMSIARQVVVERMAVTAQGIAAGAPEFRAQLEAFQSHSVPGDPLSSGDARVTLKTLTELVDAGTVFQQALMVNEADGQVLAAFPATGQLESLSSSELKALAEARQGGTPIVTRASQGTSSPISVVIPISAAGGQGTSALIGRAPAEVVDAHLLNLLAAEEGSVALLVGDQGQVIAEAGPRSSSLARGGLPGSEDGSVSVETVAENDRRLVYRLRAEGQPWTVIYALPHETVLALALRIAGPLVGILLLVIGIYAVNMVLAGRSVAQPLRELVGVSRQVAGGALDEPVPVKSEDEIGQLGRALEDVRATMKSRLSELSLVLEVSQQVSSSLSISEGMPAILHGARQGGQAAGARAVVLNPAGQQPLMFGVGEAADAMRLLDRRLTALVRSGELILLESPEDVRAGLAAPPEATLPVQALAAVGIYSQKRFVGMLWVGYSQPHPFSAQEQELLRTLAGQGAGLVENARLFSTAEGGRRRLAAVLASTADAVIVTDQTNRILLINPAMESLFQLQAGAVAGRPIDDVIQVNVLLEALLDDGKRPRRVELALADGRALIVNASTIFSREGQVLGRVAVLHDISQLKKIDELKSEFVATVSHDLRGPLTYMTGYAAMLPLVGELNSDQRAYLARIESGIEQMTALVEDLLDLRRLESGRVLAKDTIVPRELLQKIAGEFAEPGRRQGIRFHVQVAPDLPNATGDIILVQRAISNLVDNAVKYAPKSGVVMLSAVHEGNEIIFSVQDRGPGIAREDQLRLFESFYQAQPAEGQEKKGYGLGLAIVKSIAEHHGGRVWFVSLPGIGSTFYLALPRNGREPA